MPEEKDEKQIRESVMESIRLGRVAMKPRWHFVLKAALAAVGSVIVFLALLYLASFTMFALRHSGILFVPSFGPRGWITFLYSFPWLLLFFSAVFVLILELLVRRYSFAYRRPLLYSVFGILVFVAIGGFFIDRGHLHGRFLIYAESHGLPLAGNFYRNFGSPRPVDVHTGRITSVVTSSFLMLNPYGEEFRVFMSPQTRLPFGSDFGEGNNVVVFGLPQEGIIQAFGIREVGDDFDFELPPPPLPPAGF